MKISKAIDMIENLYKEGRRDSYLLLGATGIGKTENVNRLGEKLKLPVIELDLSLVEPADLLGIPKERGDEFSYLPMHEINLLAKQPGILFFDEITNVQRDDVKSAALRVIHERRVGLNKLHPDTVIIAAGNNPEDSELASMLPLPLINRFIIFTIDTPRVEDWIDYMNRLQESWDKSVAAFLLKFKQLIHNPPKTDTVLQPFATPRSWTKLATIFTKVKDASDQEQLAFSIVGKEAASHLMAFKSVKLPTDEELKNNFKETWEKIDSTTKYMLIVQSIEKSVFEISKFIANMHDSKDQESLMVMFSILPREKKIKVAKELLKQYPETADSIVTVSKRMEEIFNI